MKKIMGILMAMTVLCCVSCSKKVEKGEFTVQKGKFLVAMEVGYPPFEYYDNDGTTPKGFDGLDTDRYDVVMSAATITEERLQKFDFSAPYIGNGQAIILKKDSTLPIAKMADLNGMKVGYQAETTSDFYAKKVSAAEGWTYVESAYDKVMNAYDDLKFGRIDAVVSDSLVAVDYLAPADTPFKQVWMGTPDEYFGVCMKKGNKALQDKVNAAIADIKADGTMKKIYEEVFGMDFSSSI